MMLLTCQLVIWMEADVFIWSRLFLFIVANADGKSFFKSSGIATQLIMNNILRIVNVNVVGDVVLCLGKLCVGISSALFSFLMLNNL
ncbi:Choline transporter protein 1 [Dionaea muscipula]